MKSIINSIIIFILLVTGFTGCKDEETSGEIYMQHGDEVVNSQFEIDDELLEIPYKVSFVGADFATVDVPVAGNDIEVRVKVSPELVGLYNEAAGTKYEILPEGSYSFDESGTILKGESEAELKLTITDKSLLLPFTSYLLPLTISEVIGAELSQYQTTTYFLNTGTVNATGLEPYDRTDWTIAGFSSEEANGEGANNGHAIHAIDDDEGTFWHTQWQGGEPEPPHHIIIDMQENVRVLGIRIDPRNHWQGQPAAFRVEVSDDQENWKNSGTIDDLMTTQYGSADDLQHQPYSRLMPFIHTGRFLKITITETMPDWNNVDGGRPWSTHVAEIWVL